MSQFEGVCEQCGGVVVSKYKSTLKRFCSYKCSNQWKWENARQRKEYVVKKCNHCGIDIHIPVTDHRLKEKQENWFCNHLCESAYRIKMRELQECPICGEKFFNKKCKTCSAKCGYELSKLTSYRKKNDKKDITYKEYVELITIEKQEREKIISKSIKKVDSKGRIRYYNKESFLYSGNEKEYLKEYARKHSKDIYKKHKKRMQNDELYKFKHKMRNFIYSSFRRNNFRKNKASETILGCTLIEFKDYIKSKFTEGMSFDNYGKWQIDHIIPLSTAKTVEDVIKLCHYTNLQPLWAEDNRRKSNKIIYKPNEKV